MTKQPRLLLFDGNNLIFRSYHAIKDLTASNGTPVNAVYGVLKSVRSVIQQFKPDYVLVCWDSGKKTFRHEQDATYKANRPAINDDLKVQFPLVKEALDCLSVPQMTADGVESDDLIGTIATGAGNAGFVVTIVSSDKDFFQLVSDNISVYSFTVRKKDDNGIVDPTYVRNNFGVEPHQLVDIKSLTGEKTDNIQGVRGIGPKIATKLITAHGSIFNLLKILRLSNNLPERLRIIRDSEEIIANAYSLAKIKTDVELSQMPPMRKVDDLRIDEERFVEFLKRYDLKSFLAELHSWRRLYQYKVSLV